MKRSRLLYVGVILLVVAIGLPTRMFPDYLPAIVVDYLGDALWALAIFLGLGVLLPRARTRTIFLLALGITWGIEFSQLYQADWMNNLRSYRLGGLILGYTFLPSDLVMYLCGIGAGAGVEFAARSSKPLASRSGGKRNQGGLTRRETLD